jgi:large subunit ribosomal protein L24
MKIKKNDKVIVIAGGDKGKEGKVLTVFPLFDKVLIEGVNVKNRRQRPKREGQKGQVVQVPHPIHVSNVALLDPKTGKRTRVSIKKEKGKTVRVSRKSKAVIS